MDMMLLKRDKENRILIEEIDGGWTSFPINNPETAIKVDEEDFQKLLNHTLILKNGKLEPFILEE